MNKVKAAGYTIMALAAIAEIFYILWFLGKIPGLDQELAVKIPVLLITVTLIFIVGFLGYVIATTKQPITIKQS